LQPGHPIASDYHQNLGRFFVFLRDSQSCINLTLFEDGALGNAAMAGIAGIGN
jgi:hypothetical protein